MREAARLGPESLGLIEDARIDLLRAALAVRDDDSEPEFDLPEDMPDLEDEDTVHAFRDRLIEILSEFDPEELRPTETRSRRIRALATGNVRSRSRPLRHYQPIEPGQPIRPRRIFSCFQRGLPAGCEPLRRGRTAISV